MPAAFQADYDDNHGGALCRLAACARRWDRFGITPSFRHRNHRRIGSESTSHLVHDTGYLSCVRSFGKTVWKEGGRRVKIALAPRSGAGRLARGTRCLRTPGKNIRPTSAPWRECEESSRPFQGAVLLFGYIPGVRKKRVRLANIPARLRRAQISKLHVAP